MHRSNPPLALAEHLNRLQSGCGRRSALRHLGLWLAGAGGVLTLAGCGGSEGSDTDTDAGTGTGTGTGTDTGTGTGTGTSTGTGTGTSSCSVIPEETAGPYPGDGSNMSGGSIANALTLSGIVRRDIRSSIAGASGVAAGVPLTVELDLVNTSSGCADLSGYAIYLWHCDREGRYSMYSSGITAENYLRGVQVTASDGTATFTTIFPGCYSGRWPHIHFEVYRSANSATQWTNKLRTSQLAFPAEVCQTVYAGAAGYSASVTNLSRITLASDNVFSDGVGLQMATLSGSLADGYVARLQVGIAA